MLEHFRRFAKFGLILSTVLLPMITSGGTGLDLDEISEDLNSGKLPDENPFMSDSAALNRFNKRVRDVVADMVRLEYI